MGDKTVIEALYRLAREHLDSPEIDILHRPGDEATQVNITHHGEMDALEDFENAHGYVARQTWNVTTRELSAAGGGEPLTITDVKYLLTKGAQEPYRSKATGGSVSGSGSGTSKAPRSEGGDSEDDAGVPAEDTAAVPPEEVEMVFGRDGNKVPHLHAEEMGRFACGARHSGTTKTPLKKVYDGIGPFLESDACEECRVLLARKLNLPPGKVPGELRGRL